jgi:hypothetical protein
MERLQCKGHSIKQRISGRIIEGHSSTSMAAHITKGAFLAFLLTFAAFS